jgi:hypothetical protein
MRTSGVARRQDANAVHRGLKFQAERLACGAVVIGAERWPAAPKRPSMLDVLLQHLGQRIITL